MTQLFTPRWVVQWLLHNTLGRIWTEMHPDTSLRFEHLIPVTTQPLPSPPRQARDLRILDPACGTMNFGVVAIEMLRAMYREEMDRAGRPGWEAEPSARDPHQIAPSIIANNLVGIDIDPTAVQLAAQTIRMKLRVPQEQGRVQLFCGDSLLDPTITANCQGVFDVVVTNPPYLSARNLPAELVQPLKKRFAGAWRDAYACFIVQSLRFARPGGRVGLLTMQSFMFTAAFETMRRQILQTASIDAIAHFGPGLFDVGNPGTLQTVATVMRNVPPPPNHSLTAIRLVEAPDKRQALPTAPRLAVEQRELGDWPRAAWVYWGSPPLRRAFGRFAKLATIAPPRQGLATTDNARFVRYWWEVEPSASDVPCRATPGKWHPYAKGGRFRRWYESPRHRVDWLDDGAAIKRAIVQRYPYLNGQWQWVAKNTGFYGRRGVTYSYLTSGRFSARLLEPGAIFDVAGSSLFPDEPLTILGILNSTVAGELLAAINPTINFQVGDLAQLPVPAARCPELEAQVARAIEIQRSLDRHDPTSPDFITPLPWNNAGQIVASAQTRLWEIERRIDQLVAELYGIDSAHHVSPAFIELDPVELARQWIEQALRRVCARRQVVRIRPVDDDAIQELRDELIRLTSVSEARQIEQAVGGIGRYLARGFFKHHVESYRQRPPLWVIGSDEQAVVVPHDRATGQVLEPILAAADASLVRGWRRHVDDGVLVNLAPLWRWVPNHGFQRRLRVIDQELRAGGLEWSQTFQDVYHAAGFTPASIRGFASSAGHSQADPPGTTVRSAARR
ncbi:Eco57I restriction-modification methylase domain-containing protein [Fontivita pretiosa]|uniref:Eco57I restriction-modification methylase domain-containing protein n=1 Tax=Fontivita pretiosa TaxID=2989684 RepID=UPI003D182A1D